MVRRFFPLLCTALMLGTSLPAAEVTAKFDMESWPEGAPPREDVFVVEGEIQVKKVEGQGVLEIEPEPIVDANAQVGASAKGSARIRARIWAAKRARSYPRIGLGVHGISGYRLLLNAPRRQVELVKNDEVVATADFQWTTETWTWLELSARPGAAEGDPWIIEGRAWTEGAPMPEKALIDHRDDSGMKGSGKCSIWGTPYSEQPIRFDDIEVAVEVAES
ncbi:MAG: hypothetical protein KDK99_13555 [Verrucomicrobiales bacterium]|nr:hypothetical protein [Verrucomicrobiales bacterium]